jgi:Polyketide cyclase / dehydrase and lipid transport
MNYTSCPTRVVNAPVELVWALLTLPEGWGNFYDVRIIALDPAGPAVVGQTVFAESGPWLLHLKLQFRFTQIDALNYRLGFDARFPFGITVREDLSCVPLGQEQCRVNYHCGFGFPTGWRGAVVHSLIRRELDAGPADSLARLQREAERLYAKSLSMSSLRASEEVKEPVQ